MSTKTEAYAPKLGSQIVPPVPHNLAVGYLRAFLTVLVLAHHALLAYISFAPPAPRSLVEQPRWWQAFPVTDTQRWEPFGLLIGFNDTFFMSLMFFLSGLFVWSGLRRKGAGGFLWDRAVRLGIPFVIAAAVIAPLAYYPSYLMTGAGGGVAGFAREWLSLGQWPAGPAWFIAALLAFDGLAALLFSFVPAWLRRLPHRPGALIAISAAVYIPMAMVFNALQWTTFGPFAFQTSRILHYLAYFAIGISAGIYGIERGTLASRWRWWSVAAVVAFLISSTLGIIALSTKDPSVALLVAAHLGFVLSCASSSFAFLAGFLHFYRSRHCVLDSLRDNAYGMYLIHYPVATWLQYALLGASLPGAAKGSIAFGGTLVLSWATTSMLRRVPSIARII
jgi:peptidoglycan/LPS O-acetylase OafA/YrhL